jgi:DNA-binding transcriptional regulator YiaG
MKLIRQGLERGMFMTFGEKVRSLRKEKKMSQQELASMVGVSYRTIRSWEVEGRFPKQMFCIRNWQMHYSVTFLIS